MGGLIADVVRSIVAERGGIVAFKVGITRDPVFRMFNRRWGYAVAGELFDRMDLLAASFPAVCTRLEQEVIRRVRTDSGCQNVAPGGESAPEEG